MVCTPHRGYSQRRLILIDHGNECIVSQEPDLCAIANAVGYRAVRRIYWPLYNLHVPWPFSRAQLFHLFNGSSLSRRPWVVSVENNSVISKANPYDARKLLAGGRCKRVIALSDIARRNLAAALEESEQGEAILAKTIVLHPPQATIPRAEDVDDSRIRLCFVGAAFFRKGGLEVIRAFDRVSRRHPELQLTVVSSLDPDPYPWPPIPREDIEESQRLIDRHPEAIVWHRRLPNAQCLDLMARSHVGVLPSRFDTYGYAALELMAAGCPVIATNQRAFAETVADDRGWVIELPLDETRTVLAPTESARRSVLEHMTDELARIFESIATNPDQIAPRAVRAVEHIRRAHDPATYAAKLREIYRTALESEMN